MGESPKAKVRSGSKRTPGSHHEIHKGACLEPLGSQPGSGQKLRIGTRVHARDVRPHEQIYKRDNIYTTVKWRSPRVIGPRGQVESLKADRAWRSSREPEG